MEETWEASRADQGTPGAMAGLEARGAMAGLEAREAMADLGTRETMADPGTREAMAGLEAREAMAYFFGWPGQVRELRGLGPRPGHTDKGYMAPQKNFLGEVPL